jgi:mono/diheme cytochrome c family protein
MLAVAIAAAAVMIGSAWLALQPRHARTHDRGRRAAEPLSAAQSEHARALYSTACAGCHGERTEGAIGPSLAGVGLRHSLAKIERIIKRGKGGRKPVPMPPALVSNDAASLLARWLVLNGSSATGLRNEAADGRHVTAGRN